MASVSELGRSLDHLDRKRTDDSSESHTLEKILDKHLREIEAAAEGDIRTSILLLDSQRKHLMHGAAPSLPKAYCDEIDGIEIGPSAGSCGTAAYLGHAIFANDIATDPLWTDFRDLALSHDLRSCWSTPIRSDDEEVIGTFAVYHTVARAPTEDEIVSIKAISAHVASAIAHWR